MRPSQWSIGKFGSPLERIVTDCRNTLYAVLCSQEPPNLKDEFKKKLDALQSEDTFDPNSHPQVLELQRRCVCV